MADSDGVETSDESTSTPQGQVHAFMDPISAIGKASLLFSFFLR